MLRDTTEILLSDSVMHVFRLCDVEVTGAGLEGWDSVVRTSGEYNDDSPDPCLSCFVKSHLVQGHTLPRVAHIQWLAMGEV